MLRGGATEFQSLSHRRCERRKQIAELAIDRVPLLHSLWDTMIYSIT